MPHAGRNVARMRVLVVEDDASMSASLVKGLTAEDYIVDTAADGEQGTWLAFEGDYDAIVLDLMLPRRSGFAVVAELRRAGCATPVLMLTAKTGEWDQAEALDSGADDFLSKPFSYPGAAGPPPGPHPARVGRRRRHAHRRRCRAWTRRPGGAGRRARSWT